MLTTKSVYCLLLLALVRTLCAAQPLSLNQGGAISSNYYTELPYESINGKMIVRVELAGRPHRFLFDTGAPMELSKALAAELNASVIHRSMSSDINGAVDSVSVVKLDSIKLGNVTFAGIPALLLFPDFYKCWNIDGVIGSNIFAHSIVSIAGDRHVIIITDDAGKLSLNEKHSVPMMTNNPGNLQNKPVIKIEMGGKVNLSLDFDTGNSDFLHFTDDVMTKLAPYQVYSVLAKGYGASSVGSFGLQADADKYLLKVPYLKIGEARFNNVITQTNKGGMPSIGSKVLNYGNVTLDFINGKFYFDALTGTNDLNEKQWPFQPALKGNQLVVGLIWDKGISLVKSGEQIIAIDGKDYTQPDLCELLNKGAVLAGKETAAITLKNSAGQQRNIQISKE